MKKTIIIFTILVVFINENIAAQDIKFGKASKKDLEVNIYPKDTTANAFVIYEIGDTKVENKNGAIFLKTKVYRKIKILNKEGLEHATIKLYIYNDKNKSKEKIRNIKAITHNINEPSTILNSKQVYTSTINESWKEVTFTFPNVKSGSVLEYKYDLESPFFFNFSGWTFQSDIPKVYSEFHALIPGNWKYNRDFKGLINLSINQASIKKKCFSLERGTTADCEELTYVMKDIPAFIEEEEYSTTKNNYISKIKFELAEIFYTDGSSKQYTTTWEETDKKLKYDESIGSQLKSKSFFSKNIPKELLNNEDKLSQSKSIFKYIQKYFTLNEDKTSIYRDVNVKKAFKEKAGSVSEINLSLISVLQAADIDAKIMLLSTRDRGFPTKRHPVMTDFNYLVAHITINDETYLLDASNDYLSFDMLPFQALNSYGRVLDFKNGSYWLSTLPKIKTFEIIRAKLVMDEDGILTGNVIETNNGYFSKYKRELINSKSEKEYLIYLENKTESLEIHSYSNEELDNNEKSLIENFEIEIGTTESIGDNIYLNPFTEKYTQNPFQLNQRNYPVNFGYKINEQYMSQIDIPSSYIIKTLPKDVFFKLPNNGGSFVANFKKEENRITVFTRIKLNQIIYNTNSYKYLKEFFNQIINTQNSLIALEKSISN